MKKRKTIKFPIMTVIEIVFGLILITSLIGFIAIYLDRGVNIEEFDEPELVSEKNFSQGEDKYMINTIKWDKLPKDCIGWIKIPDVLSYPIMQTNKFQAEDFYLHKNIYGEYSFSGSIYARKIMDKDFEDNLSVLYGHNMINGSMFGVIKHFENKEFFDKNKYIYIYTPDKSSRKYEIFSFGIVKSINLNDRFDFNGEDDEKTFHSMKDFLNKGFTRQENLEYGNKILVLQTCHTFEVNKRILSAKLCKIRNYLGEENEF